MIPDQYGVKAAEVFQSEVLDRRHGMQSLFYETDHDLKPVNSQFSAILREMAMKCGFSYEGADNFARDIIQASYYEKSRTIRTLLI